MTRHGHPFDWLFGAILASVAGIAVCSCGSSTDSSTTSGSSTTVSAAIRVVSLSPGVTATIVALGASDRLVGRTPWCEVPNEVPVVGSLLDLNAEALVQTHPTLILVQPPAQGEVIGLRDLALQHAWRVERFRIDSLADVQSLLENLPTLICDHAIANDCASLKERSQLLQNNLSSALEPIPHANRAGRTVVLLVSSESADAMGFGKSTYIGDALERMGVTNALSRSGYPALGAEDLATLAPDTVVVISQRSAGAIDQVHQLLPKSAIYPIHAPELLQPGGGMITGLLTLRGVLIQACESSFQSPLEKDAH